MKVTCAYAPKKVDGDFGLGDFGAGDGAGGGGGEDNIRNKMKAFLRVGGYTSNKWR